MNQMYVTVPAARKEFAATALKSKHIEVTLERWADELDIEYEFLIQTGNKSADDIRGIVGHPCRVEEAGT